VTGKLARFDLLATHAGKMREWRDELLIQTIGVISDLV
jgi:hypothetical protein